MAKMEEAQANLAETVANADADAKAAAKALAEVEGRFERLDTSKGSADRDIDELETRCAGLESKLVDTNDALDSCKLNERALQGWKDDAIRREEAAAKQLEDTKSQLAKDITRIKAEQAAAEAAAEVAATKAAELTKALQSAQDEAKGALQNKNRAVEELKISAADSDAKQAKIEQLNEDLANANAAKEAALAEKTEAREQSTNMNEEVGMLRKQLNTAKQSETATSTKLQETTEQLRAMESLAIENDKVMAGQLDAFNRTQSANKELKDAVNKLMVLVKKAESSAKASEDAVKSGGRPEPVMSTLRAQAAELSENIALASESFNPDAGVFAAGDLKSSVERGTLGSAPASAPRGSGAPPPSRASAGSGKSAGRGSTGPYMAKEGTLEKMGGGKTGRGKNYKKRHFRLAKATLTYSASSKKDAKVLGIIQLPGGKVSVSGADLTLVDGQGREYDLRAKDMTEASAWASALEKNIDAAANEDDDE
eukprot:SAG31_NODE_2163_length_6293_cov_2.483532_3_plen_484_part_00